MTRTAITRGLLIAATAIGGLFGWELDRALVATAAWRDLGPEAWAEFSRHADLGPGNIVYPICAGAVWVLVLGAAISFRFDRAAPRAAALPIYLAALSTLGAIATTVVAAPVMQSVGHLGNDHAALQRAFDTFTLWGVYVRGVFFALIFLFSLWSLVAVMRQQP
jgi:hypothetical protein